jgi:uncharacterized protein (DUF1330 family)
VSGYGSYAVAHLQTVTVGPEIAEYLARIDATLEPFGGRFLVHGARAEVVEGPWQGDLVVIGFPDLAGARAWYSSAAYREIVGLRTGSSTGWAVLVEGVTGPHRATDVLAAQS